MRTAGRGLGAIVAILALAACSTISDPPASPDAQPTAPFIVPGTSGVWIVDGDDWSLPSGVTPAPNSGFFSESADAATHVDVRSIDVTWGQLQPVQGGQLDTTRAGSAEGMTLAPLASQLADGGPFWMRIFASGETWAPRWVATACGVKTYGPDYEGQRHLPIWNECVWSHLLETYRALFVRQGLAADPRLRFVYVPGAFTWAEFDYETITSAVDVGDLDFAAYKRWYDHAWTDLVGIFGANSAKLVFTGEDYPFGPFGEKENLLARQAVDAGLGIRTGITELSNFHLSEAPAYGSAVQPNGHLLVDETLPIHDGTRVVATENECFTDCGYSTRDPYYAVRQANLKALQLRMNWDYVVPVPSYLRKYAAHWNWTRLSLGKTAATSADAWADLRDAEDTYWKDNATGRFADPAAWKSRPFVRNLERWLVQVDVPGSVAHRSTADIHRHVFEKDNGVAYEGLSTRVAAGDTGFAFDVDPAFAAASVGIPLLLKVTYLDRGTGAFSVRYPGGHSAQVRRGDTGRWRTATLALPGLRLDTGNRLRLALAPGAHDLDVRFVRLVKTRV
ncbi:hypothetical protein [Lacisediminihabitans sp.]|uniref:hypothetical protein n=1 Tax=Lacisediminihabitans sp. TaxID=2787631 RepID=UPI00374DD1B4